MELLLARLDGTWVLAAAAFVLGATIGSFLNVVIGRLPAGESVVHPGSRCPKCATPIRPHHNVPILSWLWLRGRCAACRAPISARYPMVEAVTGFLFAACATRFGLTWSLLAAFAFVAALVAITFIDLDIWEVPDEITLPGTLIAVIARPLLFEVPWWSGLVGAALGAVALLGVRWLYFAWRGTEAMGLGDVKLIAMIGGFLGAGALVPVITLGSLVGSVIGVVVLLADRQQTPETTAGPVDSGGEPADDAPAEEPADDAPAEEPVDDALAEEPADDALAEEPADDALAEESPEPWQRPPKRIRLGLIVRSRGRKLTFGLPADMVGRTFARVGFVIGGRGIGVRRGFELMFGVFHDTRGWGHFEGIALGHPPRGWFGPLVGARTSDVEVYGEEEAWEPPRGSIPFGPFLALGALGTLLLAPLFGRWAVILGIL